MIEIYCDESQDKHTYALAGWLGAPTGWKHFIPRWRSMLNEFPVRYFHASDLENRERNRRSRYHGWERQEMVRFFARAVDVVCDEKNGCGWMVPVGVSVSLKDHERWTRTSETPWKLLFVRFFLTAVNQFPAQNGITFVFDAKPEVQRFVDRFYEPAKATINDAYPGKIHGDRVRFADDEQLGCEPLQAADLFAYEWRRRTTERVIEPDKPPRISYRRMREARTKDAALHHYDAAAVDEIIGKMGAGRHFVQAMLECRSSEE